MKKMTERKRAREEGLQLQSYNALPVSDGIFFFFLCARVESVCRFVSLSSGFFFFLLKQDVIEAVAKLFQSNFAWQTEVK